MESVEESTPQDEVKEDGFFVVKDLNGTFRVITDVSKKFEIQRQASLLDIRSAAKDIASAISTRETAEMVVALLNQSNKQSDN